MRSSLPRIAASMATAALAIGCSAAVSTTPSAVPATPSLPGPSAPSTSPAVTMAPPGTPIATIEHATGPTDVVLRFDHGLGDFAICELCGGWGAFEPGPEFTLFGDGTVIFRVVDPQAPADVGPIVGAKPFAAAHLDEERVQALLSLALEGGGLRSANETYETAVDTDDPTYSTIIVRAGGLDRRIEIHGPSPFAALFDELLHYTERRDIPTMPWAPERSWGLLIEVSSWIEVGVVSDPPAASVVSWPWAGIAPWVRGTATAPSLENPRRVMSSEEAAVLGLSDGGVVQQVFVRGPDSATIYSFSPWPTFPDDPG